jgi:DNA-binding transcriptional MerR regulator
MVDKKRNVVIAAYTEDQAKRLTGVSLRQLRYWNQDGFFEPSLEMQGVGEPSLRLYSFRDLVCLKIISQLRNESRVPLSHLREVKESLAHLGDDVWAKTTLYVLNKRVVFHNPETGEKEDAVSGQGVLQIPLQVVTGDMDEAVRALRRRPDSAIGQIDVKRSGAKNPVIAGTRIPVRSVKDFVEAGYSVDQIVEQYPSLTPDDVRAAIAHKDAA